MAHDPDPEVVNWLVQRLRFASGSLRRDDLAREVRDHAENTWGYRWSLSTAGRRVREAAKVARREGWPVITLGNGYKLALSQAERAAAAERMRRMARDIFADADRLEHNPIHEQQRLPCEGSIVVGGGA